MARLDAHIACTVCWQVSYLSARVDRYHVLFEYVWHQRNCRCHLSAYRYRLTVLVAARQHVMRFLDHSSMLTSFVCKKLTGTLLSQISCLFAFLHDRAFCLHHRGSTVHDQHCRLFYEGWAIQNTHCSWSPKGMVHERSKKFTSDSGQVLSSMNFSMVAIIFCEQTIDVFRRSRFSSSILAKLNFHDLQNTL